MEIPQLGICGCLRWICVCIYSLFKRSFTLR